MPTGITRTVGFSKKRFFLLCCFLLIGLNLSVRGQCTAENKAFLPGEKVTYDLFFNWKFIWTKAGSATLTIEDTSYHGTPGYRLDLIATGNKKADTFFKLRDTLTSVVTKQLEPVYFRKGAVEGKRYWVDEAFFSSRDGMSYVNQKRTRDGEVKDFEHSDSRCIHDMLSILAQARSFDFDSFKPGHEIKVPMATGRRMEVQTLIYRGKESFKAENDITYNCIVISLVTQRKDKDKEVVTFYITDDKNHLPVRLDLAFNFGSARGSLRSVEGNRYPLTAIKEKK